MLCREYPGTLKNWCLCQTKTKNKTLNKKTYVRKSKAETKTKAKLKKENIFFFAKQIENPKEAFTSTLVFKKPHMKTEIFWAGKRIIFKELLFRKIHKMYTKSAGNKRIQ